MQNSQFFTKVKDKNNIKGKCGVCRIPMRFAAAAVLSALFYTGDILGSDPQMRLMFLQALSEKRIGTIVSFKTII